MALNDIIVFDRNAGSMVPVDSFRGKSEIAKFFKAVTTAVPTGRLRNVGARVSSAARLTRQAAEGGIIGGGLGYLHATLPDGLDMLGVPWDAVSGGVFAAASIAMPNSRFAEDMHNNAQSCATVYAFRKVHAFIAEKRKAGSSKTSRIAGEGPDPIVTAADKL